MILYEGPLPLSPSHFIACRCQGDEDALLLIRDGPLEKRWVGGWLGGWVGGWVVGWVA